MDALGKIVEWNDDKGYGFLLPVNPEGARLFFHIRDYQQQGRRPEVGELVRYRAGAGKDGRKRAERVVRVVPPARAIQTKPRQSTRELPGIAAALLILIYISCITWATLTNRLPSLAALVLVFLNGATYIAYVLDKYAAQRDRQRVPENTLHLLEVLGGWPAALFAQKTLRHKTRKQSYRIAFWLAVAVNCIALGFWLIRPTA